jgi:hypothetical protein
MGGVYFDSTGKGREPKLCWWGEGEHWPCAGSSLDDCDERLFARKDRMKDEITGFPFNVA